MKVDPVLVVEPNHIVDEIAVETDDILQEIENMDRLNETTVSINANNHFCITVLKITFNIKEII